MSSDAGPLAYRPDAAARKLGIGRTSFYGLMATGQVETVKIGRSRLVPAEALDRFLHRLIAAQNGGPGEHGEPTGDLAALMSGIGMPEAPLSQAGDCEENDGRGRRQPARGNQRTSPGVRHET